MEIMQKRNDKWERERERLNIYFVYFFETGFEYKKKNDGILSSLTGRIDCHQPIGDDNLPPPKSISRNLSSLISFFFVSTKRTTFSCWTRTFLFGKHFLQPFCAVFRTPSVQSSVWNSPVCKQINFCFCILFEHFLRFVFCLLSSLRKKKFPFLKHEKHCLIFCKENNSTKMSEFV